LSTNTAAFVTLKRALSLRPRELIERRRFDPVKVGGIDESIRIRGAKT
jgi:hypothetical protein